MTKDAVDIALSGEHADRKQVLKGQLRSIEEEIVERRLIAADTSLQVHDEVGELDTTMANLRPAHEHAPDVERKDRMILEREKLDLTKEIREEQRDTWKDVQNLKREEREVEKELTTEEHEHKRTKELL
jgi:D-ribose pyranose/furanose isomerase RbsD